MNRRRYLTVFGSGLVALGGCSGGDDSSTPTETDTATPTPEPTPEPTPTPTATPEPTPTVTAAGPMLNRGEYSASESDVESFGQGGEAIVGAQYDMPVSDGRVEGLAEATAYDSAGTEMTTLTSEIDAVVADDQQYQDRHLWFWFATSSWDLDSYTVELAINSESYGTTSAVTEIDFDLVEPLGEGEVEIDQVDPSDQIFVGQSFQFEFTATNLSDRDSSLVVDTPVLEPSGGDPIQLDFPINENIAAGDAVTITSEEYTFNVAGTYTFRLEEQDAEFTFVVEE